MFKMLHSKKGFTLIELMIVVAIIGILAAIAIPNFLRYQAKSKQSEAKVNLKGIFTSESSYFGEHNYYGTITGVGFQPAGGWNSAKYYGFEVDSTEGVMKSATVTITWPATTPVPGITAPTATIPAYFTCAAAGNIDGDATLDYWYVNADNALANTSDDVSN